MKPNILQAYLAEIARIRATGAGTNEISYYGALTGALNAAGQSLKPHVFCVPNLRNQGAGFPDMGLFVAARGLPLNEWPAGHPPERGVVEVDDIPADLAVKLNGAQVARYLAAYGLVLVTNFRDFVLLGRDAQGRPQTRERFSFACADAAAFFALAHAASIPPGMSARFAEFLERVLLHQAPLEKPEQVAFFLASYARDARARIEAQASLPAFAELRAALQDALGMRFEGEKGEHLFRGTLVQTLFYGLFSAWVELAQSGGGTFDWRAAGWNLHVPFVDTLFQRIATPNYLKPLGLEEPLSWAAEALNRVDRSAFFARFQEADAIRYFYEPFLQAYDPDLRRDLGVWYTPREIVRYMVERVDQVLRSELDIADGLADPSVWVLDPCCGTGAYLVEVLDRIRRTLAEKGEDALIGEDLKLAAMTRVAGFEIMPAPYVIAHWQIGHFLREAGVPLADNERAAIYLTNALTGWAAPNETPDPSAPQTWLRLSYPPLADERDEAAKVKRARPILVVIGNPPYNAYAGTSPAEESGLVTPYKEGLQKDWGIRKFNLDDLYIRFFRIAERRIAETTGRGIVCYITNHSWLWYPSYVVMRRRLVSEFDRIWIDNLNGSKFETGKVSPDGSPDPSVFSTEASREGIQVGTAIALMVRRSKLKDYHAQYRNFWGTAKRQRLIQTLCDEIDDGYSRSAPDSANRFSLLPFSRDAGYTSWMSVVDIGFLPPQNGLMEKRGRALIDHDRKALHARMTSYFDPLKSWAEVSSEIGGLGRDAARFPAEKTRELALKTSFQERQIVKYFLRPFDYHWAYVTKRPPIWNRPRPLLLSNVANASGFLVSRPASVVHPEGFPITWVTSLGDNDALRGHAYYSPICRTTRDDVIPNLSVSVQNWLVDLSFGPLDEKRADAYLPWHHALAIGYSPAYLAENADGIRQNFPRVPLPDTAALLAASAALGARVAALLDPDTHVPGVTAGLIAPLIATIAVPSRRGGGALTDAERELTASWGHAGKNGAVMPGRGRLTQRPYTAAESLADTTLLGAATNDIHLNDIGYWRNVPDEVWSFTIGGYQVIKKYLSYRERPLLGRPLTPTELRYIRDIARRLAALRLMAPELDANYRACAAAHVPLLPASAPT